MGSLFRAYSSVGKSARLISARSVVQLHLGPPIGGVAQLGERLLCKQEVIGSIPFTSIFGKAFLFFENRGKGQDRKGIRRMSWHRRAMKDAAGCENPRGAASKHRSVGFRMGKPVWGKAQASLSEYIG
jgi:hypothetical protein